MNTKLNAIYFISILSALAVAYIIPYQVPAILRFGIVPIFTAILVVYVLNNIMPGLDRSSDRMVVYTENNLLGAINSTGYYQIFPPLLFVLILGIILLYSGRI